MSIVSALKGKGISKAQKQDALWGEMLGIVRIVKYSGEHFKYSGQQDNQANLGQFSIIICNNIEVEESIQSKSCPFFLNVNWEYNPELVMCWTVMPSWLCG